MFLFLVVGLAVILIPLVLFYLNKVSKKIDKNVERNYNLQQNTTETEKIYFKTEYLKYIEKILQEITFIQRESKDTIETTLKNETKRRAICMSIINIGEFFKAIKKNDEKLFNLFDERLTKRIIVARNFASHNHNEDLNLKIVMKIIKYDLNEISKVCLQILEKARNVAYSKSINNEVKQKNTTLLHNKILYSSLFILTILVLIAMVLLAMLVTKTPISEAIQRVGYWIFVFKQLIIDNAPFLIGFVFAIFLIILFFAAKSGKIKVANYSNRNYETDISYNNGTRFGDDLHENPAYKDIPCNIWHQS